MRQAKHFREHLDLSRFDPGPGRIRLKRRGPPPDGGDPRGKRPVEDYFFVETAAFSLEPAVSLTL
jgi:hypothetical protein